MGVPKAGGIPLTRFHHTPAVGASAGLHFFQAALPSLHTPQATDPVARVCEKKFSALDHDGEVSSAPPPYPPPRFGLAAGTRTAICRCGAPAEILLGGLSSPPGG